MDIVLVHGYNVTSTKTYGLLPQRLKALGHDVKDVYLSKYVTLDDDITLPDIVRAFQAALTDTYGANLEKQKFACITHSTGGLVARGWITTYYASRMSALPISHLIMLAPPNHGSRLASLGKSRLSRLRNLVGIEPGLKVLDALELGSDYQWSLDDAWIAGKTHQADGFYPFVVAGQWIDFQLWDAIIPATYERGSDGVVRAAAANLNMQRFTIGPANDVTRDAIENVPYLIPPKTAHSDTSYGIMGSIPATGNSPVLDGITEALSVKDRAGYAAVAAFFDQRTTQLQQTETYYDGSKLDRYCQIIFRVTDNMGNRLDDYAVELIDSQGRADQMPQGFFADQHKNENSPEFFVFFLNYDRLSRIKDGRLGFRIQSMPNTPLVAYADATHTTDVRALIKPNQTIWVNVVMRRRLNKNLFRMTPDVSEQKIQDEAGPDWIE